MDCKRYSEYETGKYPESLFMEHVKSCEECRKSMDSDMELMEAAAFLGNSRVDAPDLWDKIERGLENENRKKRRIINFPSLRIAATVLFLLATASWFIFSPSHPSGLLTESALAEVERTEDSYHQAIKNLEQQVMPSLQNMNIELALNFRERLETIDQQIELCREELKTNPANIHIRKYLMAALTEKRKTLEQIKSEKIPPAMKAG